MLRNWSHGAPPRCHGKNTQAHVLSEADRRRELEGLRPAASRKKEPSRLFKYMSHGSTEEGLVFLARSCFLCPKTQHTEETISV